MNQKTFCNTAWYELHIYHNGDFGLCCAEEHRPDGAGEFSTVKSKYNIQNMSMREWYNSDIMQKLRKKVACGNGALSNCAKCYLLERTSGHSRRHEQLQKSAIFPKHDFLESYKQSPHHKHFVSAKQDGLTSTLPIDFHIDLGNFCNAACKMCHAPASSKIATQEFKWGNKEAKAFIGTDWTKDSLVWYSFLEELVTFPIKNIHMMGGETLLTPRFEQMVDYLLEHNRFDVNISFVTNGTLYNDSLMKKLLKFQRIGIEVSAETMDERNAYIRLGTDFDKLVSNVFKFKSIADNKRITVTMRSAPSNLSIGTYHTLLKFCMDNNLLLSSTQLDDPPYLEIKHLPDTIKQKYLQCYYEFAQQYDLNLSDVSDDFNRKSMIEHNKVIAWHTQQAIDLLNVPRDDDSDQQLQQMIAHSQKWDSVYKLDMLSLYPEFGSFVQT